jgi:hypothetical protein
MNKRLPASLIWCVAAAMNALVWTGLCRLGFWLAGSTSHGTYVPTIFVVVALGSFACMALLANGRRGG